MNTSPEQFYDNFQVKLIKDYLTGNQRMEKALHHALEWIPAGSTDILDIGCGIGWSSHEVVRHFPSSQVKALDLSQELLDVGIELFEHNNIDFGKTDVTESDFHRLHKFDAILMLDVYEHVPKESRILFHQSLKGLLKPNGRLILSCPTKHHQQWLETNNPDGLQPIDEHLELIDMLNLANDLDAEIVYFGYVDVWYAHQYFHSVIEKDVSQKELIQNRRRVSLERNVQRIQRVAKSKFAKNKEVGSILSRQKSNLGF